MLRASLILWAVITAGCRDVVLTPAVNPEALRQKAAVGRAAGQTEEATALLRAAIAAQPTTTRDQRAAAADLRRELASLRVSADDLKGAETLYREALPLLESAPSGAVAARINLRTQLAGLCYRQSRLTEAADLYASVLALEVNTLGETHPDALGTMSILGGLELKIGHSNLAEQLFRRQLAGAQKFYGAEKREIASILDNLAETLERQDQSAAAAQARAEAKRIRQKLCAEC